MTSTSVRSGAPPGALDRVTAAALAAAAIAVAAAAFLAFVSVAASIPQRLPINYNEGWNAYHAASLVRGTTLYPDGPFFANNYPPLSFYLVAWTSRVITDPIVAGRCLSIAAFAAWTALLVPVAQRLGASRRDAWMAAGWFAATMVLFTEYVGIDDPEMIGHAIDGLAVLVLVAGPARAGRVAVAAALCALALFVKQTLFVVPLASALWLATVDGRSARWFTAIVALASTAGALWCVAAFGPAWIAAVAPPRAFLAARAAGKTALWTWRLAVPGALLFALLRRSLRDSAVRFCATSAAVGLIAGAGLSGGDGINANVFFDAIWALALAAAIGLTRFGVADGPRVRARLLLALAAAPLVAVLLPAARAWQPAGGWGGPRGDGAAAEADIAFLAGHAGRALCEELALCYWASKPVEADLFHVRQRMLLGGPDADELARLVEARAFSIVQLDAGGRRLNDRFARAIAREYVVAREGAGRRLYVPR